MAGRLECLPQLPQQLHAVHLRHLDVEDGDVRRRLGKPGEGRRPVVIGADLVAFGLEKDLQGLHDVLVVVHEGDGGHKS